jgi:hypothetical protein
MAVETFCRFFNAGAMTRITLDAPIAQLASTEDYWALHQLVMETLRRKMLRLRIQITHS